MPTDQAVDPPSPPRRRAECIDGPRPCPWTTCRYHLRREPASRSAVGFSPEASETCALDLAERGGMTLQEVAGVLGLTRERIRQIEKRALRSLKEDVARLVEA